MLKQICRLVPVIALLMFNGCAMSSAIACKADEAALRAAIEKARGLDTSCRIEIADGTIYLSSPIELDARDNDLTISGGVISGGVKLDFAAVPGKHYFRAKLPKSSAAPTWLWVAGSGRRERARYPEKGTLDHLTDSNLIWLGTQYGGWTRPPTEYEMTHLRVKSTDLPAFEVDDAEIHLIHQWSSSRHGIKKYDPATGAMEIYAFRPENPMWQYPPGSFNRHEYFLTNVSCGLTPGKWLYHRAGHEVWYCPLSGEKPDELRIEAANLSCVIKISGSRNVVLQDMQLRCVGGEGVDAALAITDAEVKLEHLYIHDVSGRGIDLKDCRDTEIAFCKVSDTGDSGIRGAGMTDSIISNCAIANVGDRGICISGDRVKICANDITDCAYSGIIFSAGRGEICNNRICRAMIDLVDGAGIYVERCRDTRVVGNTISGIPAQGLRHGIYFDEMSHDGVAEKNQVEGHFPVMVHKSAGIVYRNNVFSHPSGELTVDLVTSDDVTLENNRISAKKITFSAPKDSLKLVDNIVSGEVVNKVKAHQFSFFYDASGLLRCKVGAGEEKAARKDWRRIVCLGDSITAAGTFVGELQLYLSCKYPAREIEVFNAGVGGDTAAAGLARLKEDVLDLQPDMVIVAFGMNDVGRSNYTTFEPKTPEEAAARERDQKLFRKNLDQIITELRKRNIDVVLLPPFPYDEYGTREGKDNKFAFCNSVGLENLANYCYTTYGRELPIPGTRTALCRLYADYPERRTARDRVHPDKFGHWLIADEIVRTLFDREKGENSLPFPLIEEMVDFSKLPPKWNHIHYQLHPLQCLGRGGEVNAPTQVLRDKLLDMLNAEGELRLIKFFEAKIRQKGADPQDEKAADAAMGDFVKRWNMVKTYQVYQQLRARRAQIMEKTRTTRREYFDTLRELRKKPGK